MEKLKTIMKFSHRFAKAYGMQYLKMLIKPCLIGLLGFIFLPLMSMNPIFAIFALVITLPCFFYAFWRGFCVTYLLNYASFNLIKENTEVDLKSFEAPFKAIEKDFIKYISFCAIVSVVCYLPCFLPAIRSMKSFDISNPMTFISAFIGTFLIFAIISVLLIPFINFFTQAYFFKREDENYLKLIFNCYKKLDKLGVLIALIITIVPIILTSISSFFAPVVLILNLYFYSINTYWYASKSS